MKDRGLKKVMNSLDIIVVAFGAMIGWGWVVSSGRWIQNAGVLSTIIGFIIGGTMIYFVGMIYAELTTAMPRVGGELVFSYKALGVNGSYICVWALILSYIGVVCFEACSVPEILQYVFPSLMKIRLFTVAGSDVYLSGVLVAGIATVAITVINIVGIKAASVLQTVLTIALAAIGVALIVSSAIRGTYGNLTGQFTVGNTTENTVKNMLSVAVVAPFFLFGFDVIPQVAEEINISLKKVGRLLLMSIVLAVLFYALIVLSIGLALNPNEIREVMDGSGLAAAYAMEKVFNSKVMAKVLIIGGLCGIVTSWNSFLIGGSRAIFAMAESNMIPSAFSKLHPKHKTPITALILVGILSLMAPFFGRTMLVWISDAASFTCCLAYCIVGVSFLLLRKKEPQLERPFRVKHYKVVGVSAIAMSGFMVIMYIIPGTGCTLVRQEWIIVGSWAILGLLFYLISRGKYGNRFGGYE